MPGGNGVKRAVILVSGGLDSATTLAIARSEGYSAYALSVDYGQRHQVELDRARRVAEALGAVRHTIIAVDLRAVGGSALTADLDVPKERSLDAIGTGIPITYVPARNTIFLSFALAFAEVLDTGHIFLGVNVLDYSGYPDCRPEYLAAFEKMANLATRAGVEGRQYLTLHAPLLQLTKAQIIARGLQLRAPYALTSSCYDPSPDGAACGHCDACLLRLKGFAEAGARDPITYVQ